MEQMISSVSDMFWSLFFIRIHSSFAIYPDILSLCLCGYIIQFYGRLFLSVYHFHKCKYCWGLFYLQKFTNTFNLSYIWSVWHMYPSQLLAAAKVVCNIWKTEFLVFLTDISLLMFYKSSWCNASFI